MANPKGNAKSLPTNAFERVSNAKKAGKASGKVRRNKRDLRAILLDWCENDEYKTMVSVAIDGVSKGDRGWFELVLQIIGQMPAKVTKTENETTLNGSIKHRVSPVIAEFLSTLKSGTNDD